MSMHSDPSIPALVRPVVNIYSLDGQIQGSTPLPDIFKCPIRPDIVRTVHRNKSLSTRHPHAVSPKAGMQHSAVSWGPGRAQARVPRVRGSGTHRAGQGATANSCRKGRMAFPLKVWRRWNRNVNMLENHYALCSAIAASAVPAIVSAHGHKIDSVVELPLVVSRDAECIAKTKDAMALLTKLGLQAEVKKVAESKTVRPGKGKRRNRKYVQKKGPLIVISRDAGIVRAFRNIPGVELARVGDVEVQELAPGGNVGRLIIWTEDAFASMNALYGTYADPVVTVHGKRVCLPVPVMTNADIERIIESAEVQAVVKEKEAVKIKIARHRIDPYADAQQLDRLNPFASVQKVYPEIGYRMHAFRDVESGESLE